MRGRRHGRGEFEYVEAPYPEPAAYPPPTHPDSRIFGTTEKPNTVEKTAGLIKDVASKK